MQWHKTTAVRNLRPRSISSTRNFSTIAHHGLKSVQILPSWELAAFKTLAFQPAVPARLSWDRITALPACQKWFIHDDSPDRPLSSLYGLEPELDLDFWYQYRDITVPIELTYTSADGAKTFHRSNAPLKLFLEHSAPLRSALVAAQSRPTALAKPSLYIAQCPLDELPESLQQDLPTPELVLKAGKGDVYDSSLWMGRPPTYTPLHKDPNPNLFSQLAGGKIVRLFKPEIGRAIFDAVQMKLGRNGHASFRGDEMMQGREREELEEAVWGKEKSEMSELRGEGFETKLNMGDALFIPKGWWHSIRGVGHGMNASANWWFR